MPHFQPQIIIIHLSQGIKLMGLLQIKETEIIDLHIRWVMGVYETNSIRVDEIGIIWDLP